LALLLQLMTPSIDPVVPDDDAVQAALIEPTDEVAWERRSSEAAPPVIPDRADAPVSEITERFLRVVIAHVPLARIEELHLFSPLRQSGVETGIAVIAARVPIVVDQPPLAPELLLDDEVVAIDVLAEAGEVDAVEVEAVEADAFEAEAVEVDVVEAEAVEADAVEADAVEAETVEAETVDAEAVDAETVIAAEPEAQEPLADAPEARAVPRIRHTVYTARYRLVQKGPERGKWEADVVAEAEAPLITVDLVVRGVQRRAGEESEIVRYTAAQLARALRLPFLAE
jgi:hypothetical protein